MINKKLLFLISVFLFSIILISNVFAKSNHIYLLSAEILGDDVQGNLADLDLEIKPGEGRVFFQSYPLTKVDTQISTRFAKQYACDFLNIDCSNLDFFYTISSVGPIIGGPSAGAAMTVLTIAVLDDVPVKQDVIMTGTINSGGIIGIVGSVPEKLNAARINNFTKVLVPKWSFVKSVDTNNNTNFTLFRNITSNNIYVNYVNKTKEDVLKKYIPNIDLAIVKEVFKIEEALYYFTEKNYSKANDFVIPNKYINTMNDFSELLCKNTDYLQTKANFSFADFDHNTALVEIEELYKELEDNYTNSTYEEYKILRLKIKAFQNYNNSINAFNINSSYSAASFCFVTNTLLTELYLNKLSNETIDLLYNETKNQIDDLRQKVREIEIDSIIKLQTEQIVLERLLDSEKSLNKELDKLAYSIERLYSAKIWADFFNIKTEKENINPEILKNLCKTKIMEAQERVSYLDIMFPFELEELHNQITSVQDLYADEEYALCIHMASLTKAEAESLITTNFIPKVNVSIYFEEKNAIVKELLAEQMNKDVFPISALSYYEYANSLKNINMPTALLYLEYSLELSNMNMYFSKGKKIDLIEFYLKDPTLIKLSLSIGFFISGLIIFIVVFIFAFKDKLNKRKIKLRK